MTIMVGNMTVSRHDSRAVAESLYLNHRQKPGGKLTGNGVCQESVPAGGSSFLLVLLEAAEGEEHPPEVGGMSWSYEILG